MAKKVALRKMPESKLHTITVNLKDPSGKRFSASFDLDAPAGSRVVDVRSGEEQWVPAGPMCDAGLVEEGRRLLVGDFLRNTVSLAFALARELLSDAAEKRITAARR
jgi:hypothetical protein